jgi:hypothetical protein
VEEVVGRVVVVDDVVVVVVVDGEVVVVVVGIVVEVDVLDVVDHVHDNVVGLVVVVGRVVVGRVVVGRVVVVLVVVLVVVDVVGGRVVVARVEVGSVVVALVVARVVGRVVPSEVTGPVRVVTGKNVPGAMVPGVVPDPPDPEPDPEPDTVEIGRLDDPESLVVVLACRPLALTLLSPVPVPDEGNTEPSVPPPFAPIELFGRRVAGAVRELVEPFFVLGGRDETTVTPSTSAPGGKVAGAVTRTGP